MEAIPRRKDTADQKPQPHIRPCRPTFSHTQTRSTNTPAKYPCDLYLPARHRSKSTALHTVHPVANTPTFGANVAAQHSRINRLPITHDAVEDEAQCIQQRVHGDSRREITRRFTALTVLVPSAPSCRYTAARDRPGACG